MEIQWYPGHMAKTRRLMNDNLKLVDVVVEIVDARLPNSSRNPLIDSLIGAKPRVLLMAKADLAEEEYNKAWIAHFYGKGLVAIACDLLGGNRKNSSRTVTDMLRRQASAILAKRKSRGIKDTVIRAMVTGIPNVGKSTMINLMAGKTKADTADRPGVTKGKQWIRLDNDIELLDMPGILWPNLEDKEGAKKLAANGAIGENAYNQEELAVWVITWLCYYKPGRLMDRYDVPETVTEYQYNNRMGHTPEASGEIDENHLIKKWDADIIGKPVLEYFSDKTDEVNIHAHRKESESEMILEAIGRRRGLLRKGGYVETEKAAAILLDELRAGKLGRITWDEVPDMADGASTK